MFDGMERTEVMNLLVLGVFSIWADDLFMLIAHFFLRKAPNAVRAIKVKVSLLRRNGRESSREVTLNLEGK